MNDSRDTKGFDESNETERTEAESKVRQSRKHHHHGKSKKKKQAKETIDEFSEFVTDRVKRQESEDSVGLMEVEDFKTLSKQTAAPNRQAKSFNEVDEAFDARGAAQR